MRPLLDELLRDPYYRKRAPKSAGREQYGDGVRHALETERRIAARPDYDGDGADRRDDSQRESLRGRRLLDLIVSGGGAHNPRDRGASGGAAAAGARRAVERFRRRCGRQRGDCVRDPGLRDVAKGAREPALGDGREALRVIGKRYPDSHFIPVVSKFFPESEQTT